MKILVIGQGYVGLTISAYASKFHEVMGYDSSDRLVAQVNSGISHIEGILDSTIRDMLQNRKYRITSDPKEFDNPEVIVICVPTPLDKQRNPDLTFLEEACKTIALNIPNKALVINESTSYPGTLRNYIKPKIESFSQQPAEHLYAISPERVDPGRADYNQENTARLYAGLTEEASRKTEEFYSSFCKNLIKVSSPEIAEAAKLFENTFRQVNIALVNEFAQIANALGIDVYETINAAATKPYGFMKFTPSAGVGGHCIPVDPTYLAAVAEKHGAPATFIRRANEVNLEMSNYVLDRIQADNGGTLTGKSVLVVGVAYKPNVADVREAAAELVIERLRERGAVVSWHDDVVGNWKSESSSPLTGADIAVVVTMHDSVKAADIIASAPYVFDTTGKLKGVHSL